MYCEHKGTFRRIVDNDSVEESPVTMVISTKNQKGVGVCSICVFSSERVPRISGCVPHHCYYGWVKNIDTALDDWAEASGFTRDPQGGFYIDINKGDPQLHPMSDLESNVDHIVRWRRK